MKRFHVHIAVDNLDANIRFYSTVFGSAPNVVKDDYAKWMLEDPRVNFAISSRGSPAGVNHMGIQVESESELGALRQQVDRAELAALDQPQAACCYARSDKYWLTDPQGIAWETFHTLGEIPVFGDTVTKNISSGDGAPPSACCAPSQPITITPAKSKACCG